MQVLGNRSVPCPAVNLTGGFHEFFSAAVNQSGNATAATFDPFASDVNFLLSTWTLEEIGATGKFTHVLSCLGMKSREYALMMPQVAGAPVIWSYWIGVCIPCWFLSKQGEFLVYLSSCPFWGCTTLQRERLVTTTTTWVSSKRSDCVVGLTTLCGWAGSAIKVYTHEW
jgi:hypothetical protein